MAALAIAPSWFVFRRTWYALSSDVRPEPPTGVAVSLGRRTDQAETSCGVRFKSSATRSTQRACAHSGIDCREGMQRQLRNPVLNCSDTSSNLIGAYTVTNP